MEDIRTTEVVEEIIGNYHLTNDMLSVILDCSEKSIRPKKSRKQYTFEDVARLCYYTGEDLTEKMLYIFGDEWLNRLCRIEEIDKQTREIRRLKYEIKERKNHISSLAKMARSK